MPKHAAATGLACLLTLTVAAVGQAPADTMKAARAAWDLGDYPTALEALVGLLEGPKGEQFRREVALLTGELHPVREICADGRSLQISGDGRFASFKEPRGSVVHVVHLGEDVETVAKLAAIDSALAHDGSHAAFVAADRDEITVVTLATAEQQSLAVEGMQIASVVFGSADGTLYAVAGEGPDGDSTDVYAFARTQDGFAAPKRVTDGDGFKTGVQPGPRGRYLAYGKTSTNPLASRRGRWGRRGGGGGSSLTIVDLRTGKGKELQGSGPRFARDGSVLAFVSAGRDGSSLEVVRLPDAKGKALRASQVYRSKQRLRSFDISPDGSALVFQMRPEYDDELFIVKTKGGKPKRLTHEIQHDLSPVFLDARTVLARIGEPRHRRAYVHDIETGERVRLFHNNTIRTIAPQYEWQASADGKKVAILAERDGNTVSPDRSGYVVDRGVEVSLADVIDRLKDQLAAERALRDRGESMFGPIDAAVRAVTGAVTVDKARDHQKKLSQCGSRHITKPGNKKARDWLAKAFGSFGYEPVQEKISSRGSRRSVMGGGGSMNVIATLRGTENPDLVYVLGSHYDSVSRGPGADDNGSGTAVTLEAARVLAEHPQPATIIFVAFTGEESGLLGSRDFVRKAEAKGLRIVGALNNDMLGWANDHRLDNTIRYSNRGIRDVQHNAALRYSKLITYDALYYKGTDAAAFYDGWGDIVGGIGSYPVLGNPHYHQSTDLLDTINHEQVAATAKTTVATLMLLASSPSRINDLKVIQQPGTVALKWTPAPEKGITSYEVAHGPADDRLQTRFVVKGTAAVIQGAAPGTHVAVRAVNERGLHGWDWARAVIE